MDRDREIAAFKSVPFWAIDVSLSAEGQASVSYTHLRAHETVLDLVCRLLLEKKNHNTPYSDGIYLSHTSYTETKTVSTVRHRQYMHTNVRKNTT